MNKFTPGPWVYIDASTSPLECFRDVCVIRGGGKQIAEFSWQTPSKAFPSKDESQANARLIAAAPDLYAALVNAAGLAEMAVMSDDGDGLPSDDQGSLIRLRAQIKAALSKANTSGASKLAGEGS